MGKITDAKVLDACHKIELAAARLYHLLARLHAEEGSVAGLWIKTAREEENHARQVEMVLRRRVQIAAEVRVDPAKVDRALSAIQTTIARAEESAPPVRQALEEAILLENVLAQFHADYAVEFTDPSYQQLFRSMMAADRDHIGALEKALDSLASS